MMDLMDEIEDVKVIGTWRRIRSAGHDGISGPLVLGPTSGVASSSERVSVRTFTINNADENRASL